MDPAIKRIPFRSDEQIRAVVRRHGSLLARPIVITSVLLLADLFFMYPLISRGPIGASVFAAVIATAFIYGTREAVIWYYTVAVITTERVIDIDRKGYFNRIVSEAPVESITDVSYGTRGVRQTVWGVGTITLKTAHNAITLALTDIQDPERISALVQELIRVKTGRSVNVHREKKTSPEQKRQLISDIMESEALDQYADYDLDELIAEYSEVFGEDSLKKLLVDALDAHDDDQV